MVNPSTEESGKVDGRRRNTSMYLPRLVSATATSVKAPKMHGISQLSLHATVKRPDMMFYPDEHTFLAKFPPTWPVHMASAYSDAEQDVGGLVDTICSGEVSNPDWINILELCDLVSCSSSHAEETARSLQRVLGRRVGNDEQSVSLALLVSESVLNNCPGFYNYLANRVFLQEVVALVNHTSLDVRERASRMLQEWSTNYPSQPIFRDTYQQLRGQGVAFPSTPLSPSSSAARDFAIPSTDLDKHPAPTIPPSLAAEFQKLNRDLVTVQEKIQTYETLVSLATAGANDDLDDVLDFLQQCQPRMNTLIEAGLAGKLDERTLEICLTVNDRLIGVLEGTACTSTSATLECKPAAYCNNEPDYRSGPMAHLMPAPAPARFTRSDAV
ncbi:hypothetical protein, variant [Aphanomyces invadans]|uniref:VHS domain-containing protein n=1 Tax=Aphanomyces invadans TaxID=157072 RepID=A0A024UAD5_9STRA|nr:hypothetical protein, variant [Aphanomyces invadans]ETW03180.1 hypothetical protein, variant [Aphanomyces invadans]|eukprot:XP_008868564.1 hypothetical protein, variant [Aphanomyces invadans]